MFVQLFQEIEFVRLFQEIVFVQLFQEIEFVRLFQEIVLVRLFQEIVFVRLFQEIEFVRLFQEIEFVQLYGYIQYFKISTIIIQKKIIVEGLRSKKLKKSSLFCILHLFILFHVFFTLGCILSIINSKSDVMCLTIKFSVQIPVLLYMYFLLYCYSNISLMENDINSYYFRRWVLLSHFSNNVK